MWVQTFLDRIEETRSLDGITAVIADLRDHLDVDHVIYHIVGTTGGEYGAYTYDPAWVDYYKSQRFFNYDPAVAAVVRSTLPVDWRTLDWTGSGARKLIGEAVNNGVGKQGLSFPLRGAGGQIAMFSVTSYRDEANWARFLLTHQRNLFLIAQYIHLRASELHGQAHAADPTELSPRERDALSFLSIGKSRSEAADLLGISEHTLRAYIDTARLKLGAANTTHAVAVAMTRGLIVP